MEKEINLYEKRKNIYNDLTNGYYSIIRIFVMVIFIFIYFFLPWVYYDNRPFLLFDLFSKKIYIYNTIFWPQDFYLISCLLIILMLILLSITVYFGRIWCGYMCPQTVWAYFFSFFERVTEGNRYNILKLNRSKLNYRMFLRKVIKHIFWILFSFITAFTFIGYFIPIKNLIHDITFWVLIWLIFFSILTYLNAGYLREQVCFYMCPYARFQSVMLDSNTITVYYDYNRGEPRGKLKNKANYGDCINCYQCVNSCPTGIDIRDGLQMGCINCGACVDACNNIMDKIGYSRDLIKYVSETSLLKKKIKIFRFQFIGYMIVLFMVLTLFIYFIYSRIPFDISIIRDRNYIHSQNLSDFVENNYLIKFINMSSDNKEFLIFINGDFIYNGDKIFFVNSEEILQFPIQLKLSSKFLYNRKLNISFVIYDLTDLRYFKCARSVFLI